MIEANKGQSTVEVDLATDEVQQKDNFKRQNSTEAIAQKSSTMFGDPARKSLNSFQSFQNRRSVRKTLVNPKTKSRIQDLNLETTIKSLKETISPFSGGVHRERTISNNNRQKSHNRSQNTSKTPDRVVNSITPKAQNEAPPQVLNQRLVNRMSMPADLGFGNKDTKDNKDTNSNNLFGPEINISDADVDGDNEDLDLLGDDFDVGADDMF